MLSLSQCHGSLGPVNRETIASTIPCHNLFYADYFIAYGIASFFMVPINTASNDFLKGLCVLLTMATKASLIQTMQENVKDNLLVT